MIRSVMSFIAMPTFNGPVAHKPALPLELRRFVSALRRAGFFANLTRQEEHALRAAFAMRGVWGAASHPFRAYGADDEDLAEGFVGEILRAMRPGFARLRVAPLDGQSRFIEGGAHMLHLPGESFVLMDQAEAARNDVDEGDRPGLAHGLVGARLIARLNRHLEQARAVERFYSLGAGNEHVILALTPSMARAFDLAPVRSCTDRLYLRNENWPHFGQLRE